MRAKYRGAATSAILGCSNGRGVTRPTRPGADELDRTEKGARGCRRRAGARLRARAGRRPAARARVRAGRSRGRARRRRLDRGRARARDPGRRGDRGATGRARGRARPPRTGPPARPSRRSTRGRAEPRAAGPPTSGASSASRAGSAPRRPGTGSTPSAARAASGSRLPSSTPGSPTPTRPGSPPHPTSCRPGSSAGLDLVDDDSQPLDLNGHGTHVASTIGEQITLGQPAPAPDYLAGIAYGASLMPVRVLDADGVGSTDDVAAGILWAARNGADVINLSLNFDPAVDSCREVPTVCDAIRRAKALRRPGRRLRRQPARAARGRGGRCSRPALRGAFAVAASTEDGCLAEYSHYGKRTDLVAPGGGPARASAARPECADDAIPILQLSYACFPGDCSRDRDDLRDPSRRRHLDVGGPYERGRGAGDRERRRRRRPARVQGRRAPRVHRPAGEAAPLLRAWTARRDARRRSEAQLRRLAG